MNVEAASVLLAEFEVASQPGNERQAMERVAGIATGQHLSGLQLENLKTAVAETVMNAMEHGNAFQEDEPVRIQVWASELELTVKVFDQGVSRARPEYIAPSLEKKLAGLESPRGWGLFLIKNMVDEVRVTDEAQRHIVELVLRLGDTKSHE